MNRRFVLLGGVAASAAVAALSSRSAASILLTGGGKPASSVVSLAVYMPTTTAARAGSWWAKKMVSGYAGALFRIRRADATEMDVFPIGTGAHPDLPDYAAIDTWTGGTDPTVTTVYDQEGSANHLTQTTVANQMVLSSFAFSISGGCRPFRGDLLSPGGSALSKYFVLPAITINAQNYGAAYGVNNRGNAVPSAIYDIYNGASSIANNLVTAGLTWQAPLVHSFKLLRAMPQSVIFTGSASATRATLQGTLQTAAAHTAATSNTTGFVGHSSSLGGFDGNGDIYGLTLFSATPTTGDETALTTAIDSAFTFPTSGFTRTLILGGCSLESGQGASLSQNPTALLGFDQTWEVFNNGHPGQTLATELGNRTDYTAVFVSSRNRNIYVIGEPTNDVAAASYASQAAAESAMDTLYTSWLSAVSATKGTMASARVVALTMPARNAVTTANFKEYARLRWNSNVNGGAVAHGYTVADLTTYAPFNTTPTTTNYVSDLIHINDFGYANGYVPILKAAILAAEAS